MVLSLIRKLVGTKNSRELKRMRRVVERVNALEPQFEALDDAGLRAMTVKFRERLAAGETLDQLLPEAFAAVREAGRRALGMRHFDVQLIGGITLHEGRIAEMRTGEGKTLVATLPVYLNALSRQGRARGDRERLPGAARRELDGADLPVPRHERGRDPSEPGPREQARGLRRRHHLRHQQRIRFRLPARQHGVQPGRQDAARAELRDRRRGRLDPDRRGAHAADHFRRSRGQLAPVQAHERAGAAHARAARRRPATGISSSTRSCARSSSPRKATSSSSRC